ncbi:hypothetical protein BK133_20685 [Paenibacillus sp. FSL H8-0548]|uniref:VanZ family protein n=1 Tax=Paenibacillus sp. FSL H8-0548 TaxID=1920422 RepID=UPI00096FE114|nr:VanZ family protein [Paenibacillus sp. FSL H8-0548]OMF26267.1 hypothetical protein BK133_20685 [Paenibacillus sp. FSL H8-0548]
MKRLELYAKRIVKGHGVSEKEEDELFDEIFDHLQQLKKQYLNIGYRVEDAEKCAIYDFGEEKELRNKLVAAINPLQRLFKGLAWSAAVIYILTVIKILFIGTVTRLMYGEFINNGITLQFGKRYGGTLNIIPFKSTANYIMNFTQYNPDIIFNNLVGNMLLFVPFGLLLPLLAKKKITLSRFLCLSVVAAVLLEGVQLITRLGVADIDDVILYAIGSLIGFGCFHLMGKGRRYWRTKQYEWKRIGQ